MSNETNFVTWMVVTCKRKDSREPRKSGFNPFLSLNQFEQLRPKESLVCDKDNRSTNGPHALSTNEGKRKA